jgi:hypothetical protein
MAGGRDVVNWSDPYERAAFEAETDELRRSIAERQERRMAGLEPELWQTPPEPVPAAVRAPQRQETASREWVQASRDFAAAAVEGAERRLKARQDRKLAALAEAMGQVIAEERSRYQAQIDELRAEVAALKAADDSVIDARGVFRGSRDAA